MTVQEEWRLPHPPERVLARLTGRMPLGGRVPGLEPSSAPGAPGRLRVRLGAGQVTLLGRGTLRTLADQAGERHLRWEAEGRRARGAGTARVHADLRLQPHGRGTLVRLSADAELLDWPDPPDEGAVEAALRHLLTAARRAAVRALAADDVAATPRLAVVPPAEVVPAAAPSRADGLAPPGARLWRAARDNWPVGVLLVGAGAAMAVWRGASGRRGHR